MFANLTELFANLAELFVNLAAQKARSHRKVTYWLRVCDKKSLVCGALMICRFYRRTDDVEEEFKKLVEVAEKVASQPKTEFPFRRLFGLEFRRPMVVAMCLQVNNTVLYKLAVDLSFGAVHKVCLTNAGVKNCTRRESIEQRIRRRRLALFRQVAQMPSVKFWCPRPRLAASVT